MRDIENFMQAIHFLRFGNAEPSVSRTPVEPYMNDGNQNFKRLLVGIAMVLGVLATMGLLVECWWYVSHRRTAHDHAVGAAQHLSVSIGIAELTFDADKSSLGGNGPAFVTDRDLVRVLKSHQIEESYYLRSARHGDRIDLNKPCAVMFKTSDGRYWHGYYCQCRPFAREGQPVPGPPNPDLYGKL